MTGNKHEAEQVVADIIIERCIEIGHGHLSGCELAAEFLVLALEPRVSAEVIDGTMFSRGHQPGPRVVRDARNWPLLEGSDESILREILGDTDIAHNAREAGD